MKSASCTGVILAGGQSSRMGQDKAQLQRCGQSMLAFCHDLLGQAGFVDVVVSRNVGDGIKDVVNNRGPLGGIYSVVNQLCCTTTNASVLILPIDMPLLSVNDIIALVEQGQQHQCPVCFDDNFLPLYLPLSPALNDYLQHQLFNNGNLKVKGLINHFNGRYLSHSNSAVLVNTNTPQQWQHSQQLLNRG